MNEILELDECIDYITAITKKFYNSMLDLKLYYEFDEILNENILLYYSVRDRFESEKSVKFTTFLYSRIKWHMLTYHRRDRRYFMRKNDKYIKIDIMSCNNKFVSECGENEFLDFFEDESIDIEDCVNKIVLKQAMANLSDLEKRIVYLTFFSEKSQTKTGEEVGLAQVTVSRKLKKILQKMRKEIGDYEILFQ